METQVTGPTLTAQGFEVSWRTANMPAPAFELFHSRMKARDFVASLTGNLSHEEYRRRWVR